MNSIFSNATQYFLAVARTGSFQKASDELYISQSAVSKQIKLLEEKLGYPLFRRTTRAVNLTPEGKRLYMALLECEQILDSAQTDIQGALSSAALSGTLRIGILSSWRTDKFDKPYLTDFFHKDSPVDVLLSRLDHREMVERLNENELDVILIPRQEIDSDRSISYVSIGEYPLMLVISQDHPLANDDDLLDKLDGVNLYTHHKERSPVVDWFAMRDMHPNVMLVPNVDSKIAAAENGQGCTVVVSCSKAANAAGMCAYPLRGCMMELVVAYKNGEDPLVSTFVQHVDELQKDNVGSDGEQPIGASAANDDR